MKRALLISLAAVVLPLATVEAQDATLWRYTTSEDIQFYSVTPLGDLMVRTRDQLVVLDPEAGTVRWSRNDILRKPGGLVINPGPWPGAAFDPIPFSPWGIVRTNDGIAMIDFATGETLWDSTAVPLEKVRGHLTVLQHGLVLVYGEAPGSNRTLIGVDLATGQMRWQQDTLFRRSSPNLQRINSLRSLSGHQPPLVDSDTTFILNLSKDGPMRIDSRTGELLWRLDSNKKPPLLREGYAPMLYSDGVLFAPYDKKLMAVNVTEGSIIWNRRRNFRSRLTQMELTPRGLVVRGRKPPQRECTGPDQCIVRPATDFFLDLLDAETGMSMWERPFRGLEMNLPFVAGDDAIFVTEEREFLALNYADGSSLELAEFRFEGGESPIMLEIAGTNFLISANQNFLAVDRAGTVLYHRYYEAPGRSLLENAAILWAEGFVAEMNRSCATDPNRDPFQFGCGWSTENPDSVFGARYQNAENWANFAYLYTRQPDSSGREGFSLVMLDKRNGQEVGRVWIDERRPDYVLDWLSGFVFVKEDDREIYALRFPESVTR